MKVAINRRLGSFALPQKIYKRMIELGMKTTKYIRDNDDAYEALDRSCFIIDYRDDEFLAGYRLFERHDNRKEIRTPPILIQALEELGTDINGFVNGTQIKIVDVPDGIEWQIHESELGVEWVAEKHRTWK